MAVNLFVRICKHLQECRQILLANAQGRELKNFTFSVILCMYQQKLQVFSNAHRTLGEIGSQMPISHNILDAND